MKLLYPFSSVMFIPPFIFLLSTSSSDAFQPRQRYTYLTKLGNPNAVFSRRVDVVALENTPSGGKKESWSPPSGKWNKNKKSDSHGLPGYTDRLGKKSGSSGSGYRYKGGVTGKGIPTFTDGLLSAESLEFSYSSSEPTLPATTPEVTSDSGSSSPPPPPSTGGYLDTISPVSSTAAPKGSYRYNPKKNEQPTTEAVTLPYYFDSFNQAANSLPGSSDGDEEDPGATSSFIESVNNAVAFESNGRAAPQPARVVNGVATSIFLEFPPAARVRVDSQKKAPPPSAPEDSGSKVKYIPVSPFCTIIEPKY